MKIVRVVSELDFGGVEKVLAISLPELAVLEGIEVLVIVLGAGGRVADELVQKGFSVEILGFDPRIPNLKLVHKLVNRFKELKPDVVHTQGAEANFHGIWAAKLAGVPRILGEEIGIPNHHSYWKWIFRWVYQKADLVLSISSAVKRTIVNLGEVPLDKVRVIYNPVCSFQLPVLSACLSDRQEVEASVGSKQRPENGAFAFVTTCRLVPIKNLTRLIQALEGLVEENPNRPLLLRVVGDGPELKNLEFIIQNLELGTKVELVGFQTDVGPYLWEADAFILPSLQEGSSVSLAEAMTAGLPSIVTKVGGAPEILGKSQSGILIDPLSTSEIQNAMQSFLDLSVDERKEMGQRAQEEAKRFSVENYIESLMSVYGLSDFILPAAAGLQPSDL